MSTFISNFFRSAIGPTLGLPLNGRGEERKGREAPNLISGYNTVQNSVVTSSSGCD